MLSDGNNFTKRWPDLDLAYCKAGPLDRARFYAVESDHHGTRSVFHSMLGDTSATKPDESNAIAFRQSTNMKDIFADRKT